MLGARPKGDPAARCYGEMENRDVPDQRRVAKDGSR